jgi:phosphatidylglycerol lysyltransferase
LRSRLRITGTGWRTAVARGWIPTLTAGAALLLAVLFYDSFAHLLKAVRYDDVVARIAAASHIDLLCAAIATILSYLALTGYDLSALRYAGARVKRTTVLFTSFIAYALGNSIGVGVLTGGAVRMRLYTAAGVEAGKVAQAIAFNATAFGFGMLVLGASGVLWGATQVSGVLHLPAWLLRTLAAAILLIAAAMILASMRWRELHIARWTVRLPAPALALRQLASSVLDLAASAAALWFLLPDDVIGLPSFVAFYSIGVAAGLISHVPGGLGVFEAVILLACGGRAPPGEILGALVLYRCIYYLAPLILATVLLVLYELRFGVGAPLGRAAAAISPWLLAALTLVAGGWLLVSGATPATSTATEALSETIPLPLLELSHFMGSIAGLALLIVARGLLHRLDAAWWCAFVLAIVASILAIPKGIAISEACFLGSLAALLWVSRGRFTRQSSLFAQRFERGWLFAIGWIIAASIVLMFLTYRDVAYQRELLWQFEFDAHAPRSMRALVAVATAGLAFALWQLLRPAGRAPPPPDRRELERAADIIRRQPAADACLALIGDKRLLFSASGNAFIMYGQQRRSWISLFDPIGDRAEWPELIWRLIELAAAHGGRAAFYQVRPESLALYLDAGLRAWKLGEYAYVPLHDFSLRGTKRARLRQSMNHAQREGLEFAVLTGDQVAAALPELQRVSQAWLTGYRAREKGFSLGRFSEAYLLERPIAVVRRREHIVAFANLLHSDLKAEISIDLMRHLPTAPGGAMDFLFVSLLQYSREAGYERFGLGMAPLSGMATHELAPRWHRFGKLLFDRGERFYNFRGLRNFKEKFEPVWEPRYLAAPGGAAPVLALSDIAALISGGVRGVIAR